MSKFDAYKWIKNYKSQLNEAVRKPRSWDSQFAMNAIEAYERGEFDPDDDKSLAAWEKKYNGGRTPNPPFETYDIIHWALTRGKKPDGSKMTYKESVNEAEEGMDLQSLVTDYIEETKSVLDHLQDLEQQVAGGIDRYAEETGDYRLEQTRNQTARYIQSAERNLDALLKMLERAKKFNV